jgi:hypothetical protein
MKKLNKFLIFIIFLPKLSLVKCGVLTDLVDVRKSMKKN